MQIDRVYAKIPLSGREKNFIVTQKLPLLVTRVSDPDPDSIGSVDPDRYSESGSGSRRTKLTHKSRKN
jgi:hypothetical protein